MARKRGITKPIHVPDDVDSEPPDYEFIKSLHGGRLPTKEEMLKTVRKQRTDAAERSQRATRAAITRAKNKEDPDKTRTCVSLNPDDKVYLRWLGKNNLSKGIRIAAKLAKHYFNPAPATEDDGDLERIAELRGELKRRAKELPR